MSRAESGAERRFPAVEELMPHRGCVVLLDRVLSHDADSTQALVCLSSQRWLKRGDGSVASWMAIEYMAQCVAAREGLLSLDEGRPLPSGFLVGVTGLRLHEIRFGAEDVLRVCSRRVRGRPALGALSHQCSLHLCGGGVSDSQASDAGPGRLLAEGRLSVSVRPDATE